MRYGFIKWYIICIVYHLIFAAHCHNNSASEEDTEVFEESELPDFTPFMARFRSYKKDLSDVNKMTLMTEGMESLRDSVFMADLIEKMFDYEQDTGLVESEIFDQPDRMEVVFNYINLTFQLLPATSDEAYTKRAEYLHTLLQYYDKKLSLSMSHSKKIKDVF